MRSGAQVPACTAVSEGCALKRSRAERRRSPSLGGAVAGAVAVGGVEEDLPGVAGRVRRVAP
jgi:hypothetical protein